MEKFITFIITDLPADENYVGEYKNGKYHGKGTYTSDNWKYVGEWKNGKRNGMGTLTFPTGLRYVGKWKDDKKYGMGTITFLGRDRKIHSKFVSHVV